MINTVVGIKADINLEASWKDRLAAEFKKEYFIALKEFLTTEKKNGAKIFPAGNQIFAALNHTPFNKVKVVIIGQDPYHGEGQANGLSFSVSDGIRKPPSLLNIFKELQTDTGAGIPESGNLTKWADQGVLLLNATLTVRAGEAGSHQNKGWEYFTDAIIRTISSDLKGVVFLLWGRYAHAKEELIDASNHYILKAAHPSPLARGAFFGCRHFSKTNELLHKEGKSPIDWSL
jgi:uracil-DNA glycosylase